MNSLNIQEILSYLPHRYPFLLLDKIIDVEPGKYVIGIKNVTVNEPFFAGHFPGRPIMPGVLILEALAQASGILAFTTDKNVGNSIFYFAGIDNARFKRIVIPGDQLRLESELLKVKQGLWKCRATATVEGQLACSAEILAAKRELD